MSTTQLTLEWLGELWTTWSHLNSVREINWENETSLFNIAVLPVNSLPFPIQQKHKIDKHSVHVEKKES